MKTNPRPRLSENARCAFWFAAALLPMSGIFAVVPYTGPENYALYHSDGPALAAAFLITAAAACLFGAICALHDYIKN